MLTQQLQNELLQRKTNSLYRQRQRVAKKQAPFLTLNNQIFLSFTSNDYFGLNQHPELIRAAQQAINQFGIGGAGSNLVYGHTFLHQELEEKLAEQFGFEKAIIFPSGYHANLAAISSLLKPKDVIFADYQIHASLIDGCLNSRARLQRYEHNNTKKLDEMLNACLAKSKWIISDGVFSTNGDLAPLPTLIALKKKHHAFLFIDDAHGIGCMGKQGGGVLDYYNIDTNEVDLLTGSFAKAFGTQGGFIAGKQETIEYIMQFARPYIYTNALPAHMVAATLISLEILKNESGRRDVLSELITYFRLRAQELKLPFFSSETPIQALRIGNSSKALTISEKLKSYGILVAVMRPPTVPRHQDLLRISLTTHHTKEHIDQLLTHLTSLMT